MCGKRKETHFEVGLHPLGSGGGGGAVGAGGGSGGGSGGGGGGWWVVGGGAGGGGAAGAGAGRRRLGGGLVGRDHQTSGPPKKTTASNHWGICLFRIHSVISVIRVPGVFRFIMPIARQREWRGWQSIRHTPGRGF